MQQQTPRVTQENIATVVRLEEEFEEQRTPIERFADAIGAFAGSIPFVVVHFVLFAFWVLINTHLIPGIPAFDPYPFTLLTLIVSCEGVILATFVLMKQNRMSLRADHRAHLNLQIDLLAEQEITKMLQLLRVVCKQMGLKEVVDEAGVRELSEQTAVESLSRELKDQLSDR